MQRLPAHGLRAAVGVIDRDKEIDKQTAVRLRELPSQGSDYRQDPQKQLTLLD